MPRKVAEAPITNRNGRAKLAARTKPHYRRVDGDLHLGFYKPTTKGLAGTWVARRYIGEARYETAALGSADDRPDVPADGVAVLTFDQAQAAARTWARAQAAAERAAVAAESAPTVRKAVEGYLAARKARSAKAGRDAELRLGHHVLAAPLADVALAVLTERNLSDWRDGLKRGGRARKPSEAPLSPATLARLLNDLRAALTAAARKARLPADMLTTIREGLRAPEAPDRARAKQVLNDADVRRVVEAAQAHDADFGALVLVLAATGARFDQVARITVADLQPDSGRVMVPVSHKGRGTKQTPHTAVPLPDDVIARLRRLAAGRPGHEPLLMRWHHRQDPGDKAAGKLPAWVRDGRRPWAAAAEMTRPWRAAVTAAGLPDDLVPDRLRHSSIVRGLRAGLPVRLVAAVHDTSVAMIERHYAAFVVDATEELLRRALLPMGTAEVVPLAARRA